METPIPCSAEEEHIFRSQRPAVPVPDITLNDFVLQDAELYADQLLPNVAEYGIVALGIMASGGVFSGANPAAHESELKKQVQAADAKLIVTNDLNY
ncbi:hypothetical protein H0E87_006256 [Populus deltoides]|uniref:Uncharacterized protein n=1 Tax=Populus deltoides TaxID=3696 RepID=A0A8T2Z6A9_POPDE|nr:hypothetical protein H0E87_006256 [Populus deltoides]